MIILNMLSSGTLYAPLIVVLLKGLVYWYLTIFLLCNLLLTSFYLQFGSWVPRV